MTASETTYNAIVEKAAGEAKRLFRSGAVNRVYLYYRAGELKPFPPRLKPPENERWMLAINDALTARVPYKGMYGWIWDNCLEVPCLPVEEG